MVNDILLQLPKEACFLTHHFFLFRYAKLDDLVIETWKTVHMIFIQKPGQAMETLADLRGRCKLSVISKWYQGCLAHLASSNIPSYLRPAWGSGCCFANEPEHNVDQVTLIISNMLAKGRALQGFDPLVLEGDVWSVFDSYDTDGVVETFEFWGIRPCIIHAFIAELTNLNVDASFADISTNLNLNIPFSACTCQGGNEGSWLWNALMKMLSFRCTQKWRELNYGVNLGGEWLTHTFWSDSPLLFALTFLKPNRWSKSYQRN